MSFRGTAAASNGSWRTHEFAVATRGRMTVTLDWDGRADLNLFLKDSRGRTVEFSRARRSSGERVSFDVTSAGTFTVGVKAKRGAADYRVRAAM